MYQIKNHMSIYGIREGIFMDSYPLRSRHLCPYAIVIQHYSVISRRSLLCRMTEPRAITFSRMAGASRIQLYLTYGRHKKYISQIRVPSTTEMSMTKTHYRTISILIASAIFVHIFLINSVNIMRYGISIRTQLNQSKRNTSAGKSMSHAICSNHNINIICRLLRHD